MKVCIFCIKHFSSQRTLICQVNRPLKEVWDEKKGVSNTVCYNTLTVGYTVSTKQTDCFEGFLNMVWQEAIISMIVDF